MAGHLSAPTSQKRLRLWWIAAALALLWGAFVAYERTSLCPDLGVPAVCDEPWRDVNRAVVLVFLDVMIVAAVALAIVRASGVSRYALLVFSLMLLVVPVFFMGVFLGDNRDSAYCVDVRYRQGEMLPDCRIVWSNWVSVGLSAIVLSQPIVLVLFLLDAAGKERAARRTRRKGT
jgi:hypothetical protein